MRNVFFLCVLMYAVNLSANVSPNGSSIVVNELRKVVFAIQTITHEKNKININTRGTGFLSFNQCGDVYGITCKHVIEPLKSNQLLVALDTDSGLVRFYTKIIYVDDKYDFAILDVIANVKIKTLSFGNASWPTCDIVFPGKSIITIGYPLGLGINCVNNSPIARFGMVAQEIIENHFLIDGIVNHGNSGSPVFSPEDGKLIGMITAFKTDNIFSIDSNKKIIAQIPYNSGLSIAIDVKIIKKRLDQLSKGLF